METNLLTAITLSVKVSPILQKAKQPTPRPILVLEGTVLNFSLTFDISWKVMKDI